MKTHDRHGGHHLFERNADMCSVDMRCVDMRCVDMRCVDMRCVERHNDQAPDCIGLLLIAYDFV